MSKVPRKIRKFLRAGALSKSVLVHNSSSSLCPSRAGSGYIAALSDVRCKTFNGDFLVVNGKPALQVVQIEVILWNDTTTISKFK